MLTRLVEAYLATRRAAGFALRCEVAEPQGAQNLPGNQVSGVSLHAQ
jgi:hypothetical protein